MAWQLQLDISAQFSFQSSGSKGGNMLHLIWYIIVGWSPVSLPNRSCIRIWHFCGRSCLALSAQLLAAPSLIYFSPPSGGGRFHPAGL